MNFGSKFVYWNEEVSEESFDEEELEEGVQQAAVRECSSRPASEPQRQALFAQLASKPSAAPRRSRALQGKKSCRKIRTQKADTNVVTLSLGTLAEGVAFATGDPVVCSNCDAYFNKNSERNGQVWECEFCGNANSIDLEEEELPSAESMDYIVEAAGANASSSAPNVIFCLDVSGSMCVTTEVDGKFELKGMDKRREAAAQLREFGDGSDQFLNRAQRNKTYISRLQCVQAAVESQISSLQRDMPNATVGLVTFNSEVHIYGAGDGDEVTVAGDKLSNYDDLLAIGEKHAVAVAVRESAEKLKAKVFTLEEGGATALGPALVAAVGMACGKEGSRVVLCTDGLANVGLGAFEDATEAEEDAATAFYDNIAVLAKSRGVGVSVVSIEGTECRMDSLGVVASESGGEVDVVSPINLVENFGAILSKPVLATGVAVKFLLHRGLQFRNEDVDAAHTVFPAAAAAAAAVAAEKGKAADEGAAPAATTPTGRRPNRLEREVGNVNEDTTIAFEYEVAKDSAQNFASLKSLPFQVQIFYKKLDGMRCVRVISQVKELTQDRQQAEAEIDIGVVSTNAIQKQAKWAKEGDYTAARSAAYTSNRLMARNAHAKPAGVDAYSNFVQRSEAVDASVRNQQFAEWDAGLDLSDSDDDDVGNMERKKAFKKKARSKARSDGFAKAMYSNMKKK